jgi:hypothetical protein
MMVEGHKMNLIYYDSYRNKALEDYVAVYGEFLKSRGEQPVSCGRAESADEVFRETDLVGLHPVWQEGDISPFLGDEPPKAAPSIVNARELDIQIYKK